MNKKLRLIRGYLNRALNNQVPDIVCFLTMMVCFHQMVFNWGKGFLVKIDFCVGEIKVVKFGLLNM